MTLLACGINHQRTPLELRERAAFSEERSRLALQELLRLGAANEAVILSTCNRVEIYTESNNISLLQQWFDQTIKLPLEPYWYMHQENQAVSHIMRVASGLDSMVLGESQILAQMKSAFNLAQEVGSLGTRLQRLFQRVFSVSKQVRADTKIGANPITLGYAAVNLAKRIFSDLSKCNVLLIGAGEVIELTAFHLYNQGIKRFVVASRSQTKAEQLANKVYGHGISMRDIPIYLQESDIVITATSSDLPILGKGSVERAIKARKHRPIFMVDLAVPRDIEPEVVSLEDIYLYNIDDLKSIINENHQCRAAAALEAESIIELQAQHFIRDMQSLDANNLISAFRSNLSELSDHEIQKAKIRLDQGADPKQVLMTLAQSIINKISHIPCTQMRKAAFDGRLDMLALARQLLGL